MTSQLHAHDAGNVFSQTKLQLRLIPPLYYRTSQTQVQSFPLFSVNKKKVQVGNDQEMVQSERNSNSINRGV